MCAEPQSSGDQSRQGGMIKRREKLKKFRSVFLTKWERKHTRQTLFLVIENKAATTIHVQKDTLDTELPNVTQDAQRS